MSGFVSTISGTHKNYLIIH